jgi:hypothetical protein
VPVDHSRSSYRAFLRSACSHWFVLPARPYSANAQFSLWGFCGGVECPFDLTVFGGILETFELLFWREFGFHFLWHFILRLMIRRGPNRYPLGAGYAKPSAPQYHCVVRLLNASLQPRLGQEA